MIQKKHLTFNGEEFDMLPKKIYLNYVNENDVDKTWSEEPIYASDCEMNNREYTDLSQVWHDRYDFPKNKNRMILFYDEFNCVFMRFFPWYPSKEITQKIWNDFIDNNYFVAWAYVDDLLPKGGES